MAKYQKKKIQETEGGNFGKYKEATGGGGSPEKGDPTKHGHGVNSDYRQANNDTMQPRTNDGKFTYKSVNGQSIDPKYGPSRGKTVNPLLTGGENGVMIDDVEQEFSSKSGKIWNKYKDKWYVKGAEYMLMSQGKGHKADWSTRVAGDTIWEIAKRRYDTVKGEFVGESRTFKESKKGKMGKEEQAAKQLAQATGQEQAVIDQASGGIKLKPGVTFAPAPKPTPAPTPAPSTSIPAGGTTGTTSVNVNTASASDIANADYTPKYSDDDISAARDILKQSGLSDSELKDFDALSPKEKDDYIDKYFDVAEDSEETTTEDKVEEDKTEDNKEIKEEDSEAVKKVKDLGFTD